MTYVTLLDQRRMFRDFDPQVAEVRVRVTGPNRFMALGIPMSMATR